jgi:SAM-dependent methyltransferase
MQARHCVVCDRDVNDWPPLKLDFEISPFIRKIGAVGSDVTMFWCPQCQSTDRERHLKLFLDRLQIWPCFDGARVLHIAPAQEAALVAEVAKRNPACHVLGDLHPAYPTIQKMDIEALPFPRRTFDVVICNHVLEHVRRPSAALSEVHRTLKPGGRFICQTPYAARLSETLEDPLLQSEDDRIFFYAQGDHLRLFGIDIERRIRKAGFVGGRRAHRDLLPEIDPIKYGINDREPFFDFVRDGRWRF